MRIRFTANPADPGHHWVRGRFIDLASHGYVPILDTETGATRMFIPSRVENNRILLACDPGYVDRRRVMR
jgi:hypothetical protein